MIPFPFPCPPSTHPINCYDSGDGVASNLVRIVVVVKLALRVMALQVNPRVITVHGDWSSLDKGCKMPLQILELPWTLVISRGEQRNTKQQ